MSTHASRPAPLRADRHGTPPAHDAAGALITVAPGGGHPDEYQDGRSAGSLVQARRCWLDLLAADALPLPQRFTFVFGCPTERMAFGLTDFLRYTPYAGFVRAADRVDAPAGRPWHVTGTTQCAVWSLSSLEHLFMHLRSAGGRYASALETLTLVPAPPCLP